MRERVLEILKGYQREIIESDKMITIGNFSRRAGKSFTLVCDIFYERPKVCFYLSNYSNINILTAIVKNVNAELIEKGIDEIKDIRNSRDCVLIIEFKDGTITQIYDYQKMQATSIFTRGAKFPMSCDLAIFDETLPLLTINSKRYIATLSTSANVMKLYPNYIQKSTNVVYCGLKKMIDEQMTSKDDIKELRSHMSIKKFNEELDILNEYDSIYNNNMSKIIDNEIDEVVRDFVKTDKDKTISRKDKLTILEGLIKLKEGLNNGI